MCINFPKYEVQNYKEDIVVEKEEKNMKNDIKKNKEIMRKI